LKKTEKCAYQVYMIIIWIRRINYVLRRKKKNEGTPFNLEILITAGNLGFSADDTKVVVNEG
jgi:hypothetical protein